MDLNSRDVGYAVAHRSHGSDNAGREDVCNLQSNVVLAVSECRHFDQAGVVIARRAEPLRED
jgi:hypothetical protein